MLLRLFNNRGKQIGNHNDWVTSRQKTVLWTLIKLPLRSGITVASEVYPRRCYCWLKTFPNTPQDDLRYSRLCNFWWSTRGPDINQTKISIKVWITVFILSWYLTIWMVLSMIRRIIQIVINTSENKVAAFGSTLRLTGALIEMKTSSFELICQIRRGGGCETLSQTLLKGVKLSWLWLPCGSKPLWNCFISFLY